MKKTLLIIMAICLFFYLFFPERKTSIEGLPDVRTDISKSLDTDQSKVLHSDENETSIDEPDKKLEVASVERTGTLVFEEDIASQSGEIQSLDTLLMSDDNGVYFKTESIDSMGVNEIRGLISELSNNLMTPRAVLIKENLAEVAYGYQGSSDNVLVEDVQCSDQLCGFMLSSTELSSIQDAIDFISSNEKMKNSGKGGTLKVMQDNGIYYGIIIASISEKQLFIQ